MAQDRPSWREIDKKRDGTSGRRKRKEEKKHELQGHSTRYDRYKADLDRLFDQGLAGELLKKTGKESEAPTAKEKVKAKAKAAVATRTKKTGRIPKNTGAAANRLKLIRSVIDAQDTATVIVALDEMMEHFGLPDDWEVLIRALEHSDEALVLKAVAKMKELLPNTVKIPRRFTLKERLRTICQTAQDDDLRQMANSLEERL